MLGWGKTGTVDASGTVSPPPSQEIYQCYAVALYRQALLNLDDSATGGYVVSDPIVNECALAAMPEPGEDGAGYHLAELVFRRARQWPSCWRSRIAARGREHSDSCYPAARGTSGSAHCWGSIRV